MASTYAAERTMVVGKSTGSEASLAETSAQAASEQGGGQLPPELPAEELKRRTEISKRLAGAFGEIVSVLMRSEAHRTQMLMDLEWLVLPALATGQFSVAAAQSTSVGYSLPVGVVLWARVSPEVDQRLAANLDRPMRLKPEEWASGDNYWLVEAVGDSRVIAPMVKGLAEREWKGKQVKFRARNEKGQRVVKVVEPGQAPPAAAASMTG